MRSTYYADADVLHIAVCDDFVHQDIQQSENVRLRFSATGALVSLVVTCAASKGLVPLRTKLPIWRDCGADAPQHRALYDGRMKPRITLITLAVDDLDRAVAFYRDGLGWPTQGIVGREIEHGAVAFFELQGGLKLALWPRASLAHDSGLAVGAPCPTAFSLAHNVNSAKEVDEVLAQAKSAGGAVVKAGHPTAWGGYAGYFQDTEGNLWEVAWNPQWPQQE